MKSFPSQGFGRVSKRPEEIALICFYQPNGVSTVKEMVTGIQTNSKYSITIINLYEHRVGSGYLELNPAHNLDAYSAIIIHNTVAYNVNNLINLDRQLKTKFTDYEGVKIMFKQDENFKHKECAEYIAQNKYDMVFTCLPDKEVYKVYPKEKLANVKFIRMMTGYITPYLRSLSYKSVSRSIDIGYRGSIQPLSFGRLAYEKRKIGEDVKRILSKYNLNIDISNKWEDRYGGSAWFDFLRRCKATLGVESGASIFDLDGDLEERCANADKELGMFRDDINYAESFLKHLEDLEGNVYYNQISPRHFEAIATGTLQLLYPGEYSSILTSYEHYYPLERTYNNIKEVIDIVLDEKRREEITSKAYEEIILNKKYWIETFVADMDNAIYDALEKKNQLHKERLISSKKSNNVILLAAHDPVLDPRLAWIENGSPEYMNIHQICVNQNDNAKYAENVTSKKSLIMIIPAINKIKKEFLFDIRKRIHHDQIGTLALNELLSIYEYSIMPDYMLCEILGAPENSHRLMQFKWYLKYVLNTSVTLLSQCINMRGIHAIIAVDLDTLVVALILKGIFKVPVFYDAHEYWPEADFEAYEFEREYWRAYEGRLIPYTDYRQTVSAGLAQTMQNQYDCTFDVLPNCIPSIDNVERRQGSNDEICKFLYIGGFAPGRGIEQLINTWPKMNEKAVLYLQGKENKYRQQYVKIARNTGILNKRIHFPPAVIEERLLEVAMSADVGVIPYPASNILYENCCPNKLSQYMAVGLPILANDTKNVGNIINKAKCGYVVNFNDAEKFMMVVNELVNDKQKRRIMGECGRRYHIETYNWRNMSYRFYEEIYRKMNKEKDNLRIYNMKNNQYLIKKKHSIRYTVADLYFQDKMLMNNTLKQIWRIIPIRIRMLIKNVLLKGLN